MPIRIGYQIANLVNGNVAGGGAEGVGRGEEVEPAGFRADFPADDLAVLLDGLCAGVDDVLGGVHPREGGVHHAATPAGLDSARREITNKPYV